MSFIVVLNALVAILAGILAMSVLIVAKKPDAKKYIDKLSPFQALIGVGLIALGIINFFKSLKGLTDAFKVNLYSAAAVLALIVCSILLGVVFGMPQLQKIFSGSPPPPPNNPYAQQYQQMMMQQQGYVPNRAEQKLLELQQKILPFQLLLGLVILVAALVVLLYQFKIIKYSGAGPI
jgi:hypothetical protein